MHSVAQHILNYVRREEFLRPGDRVGIAVSGGIDSVALLRLLLELRHELGIVLSVVHFNHKLRGAESDADEAFVAELARTFDLEFHSDGDDVAQHAADEQMSTETAARELRHGFFQHLLGSEHEAADSAAPLNKIATGHTLDDQAETVLMRIIRGAGVRGLGAIQPHLFVENDAEEISGEIIRPLLGLRHRDLERYLQEIGQSWREDSSNGDERFTRNRLRKLVMPLLEKEFNPTVTENLAELSEIARGEEDYWENEASGWLGRTVQWSEPEWARQVSTEAGLVQIAMPANIQIASPIPPSAASSASADSQADLQADLHKKIDAAPWLVANATVSRIWLLGEPIAVQRRLVKAIGERAGIPLEFKHVEEILRFAAEDRASGKELSLPLGWKLLREPDELTFLTPDLSEPVKPRDNETANYEYEVAIPGRVSVHELGLSLDVRIISAEETAGYNPEQLLDAASLPRLLTVRNWRPGDRFWPAHTKSPRKIKELLSERHVPQARRKLCPVIASADESGNEIIWLRGFPSPSKYRAKPGQEALLILETSLDSKPT